MHFCIIVYTYLSLQGPCLSEGCSGMSKGSQTFLTVGQWQYFPARKPKELQEQMGVRVAYTGVNQLSQLVSIDYCELSHKLVHKQSYLICKARFARVCYIGTRRVESNSRPVSPVRLTSPSFA